MEVWQASWKRNCILKSLFVIIRSIELRFSTLLKQVGNFTRLDKQCSFKKSKRTSPVSAVFRSPIKIMFSNSLLWKLGALVMLSKRSVFETSGGL